MSQSRTVRLGTRGSTLAMIQAETVSRLIEPVVGKVEIVKIRTSGDAGNRDQLGAFVSEIQQAILKGAVDFGLHCLKDLPTTRPDGLWLAAHLEREDPRDAILTRGKNWIDLKRGAVIGTGSLRRTAQLAAHRPDLRFKPLVGNVDTRLTKLAEAEYDAIVLAMAGLKRLGLIDSWNKSKYADLQYEPLSGSVMLSAPGQGVLVLECRSEDEAMKTGLARFNHLETEQCAIAERAFMARFGGGCSVPVAALADVSGLTVELRGCVASPDGTCVFRASRKGDLANARQIGTELAEEIGARGGFEVVDSVVRPAGAGV